MSAWFLLSFTFRFILVYFSESLNFLGQLTFVGIHICISVCLSLSNTIYIRYIKIFLEARSYHIALFNMELTM